MEHMKGNWKLRMLGMCLLAGLLSAGCNQAREPVPLAIKPEAKAEQPHFLLEAEPASAKGVIDIRKDSHNGDEVVVVGRVGGSKEPMVKGRAAFTIVDLSLESCCGPSYCCTPKEELAQATVLVKFLDAGGKTVEHDARELLGIQELSTVIVRGKVKRDGAGNFSIAASELYVKHDPE